MVYFEYSMFTLLFILCAGAVEDLCSDLLKDYILNHPRCEFHWQEFDEGPQAMVVWYPNSRQYASFNGVDMVPKRHFEFFPREGLADHSPISMYSQWERGKNGPPDQVEAIKIGDCSAREEDGGDWVLQRIGPLYSNGDYDWWKIEMRDGFRLSNVLKKHADGVYFTSALLAAVSENSEILGLPPIHLHHIHVGPQPGEVTKLLAGTFYLWDYMLELHGDYECLPKDGGANCLVQKPALGNVRDIDRVVDIFAELNDVRGPASEGMKWWFQLAIRWHPKTIGQLVPESQSSFGLSSSMFLRNYANRTLSHDAVLPVWSHMPSEDDPYGNLGKGQQLPNNALSGFVPIRNQMDTARTFGMNASENVIAWATSPMFHGGELVRMKIHSHNAMFERLLHFRATTHELGLVDGTRPFPFHNAYEFTLLTDTGLKNFDDAQFYFTSNLEHAKYKYDKKCEPSSPKVDCDVNKPFLICRASPSDFELYDERLQQFFVYDRRQITCCNRWIFKIGEVTTMIGFYKPILRSVGPWAPSIPKEFPMHMNSFMDFKFHSPPLNGKPSFRMLHSYYFAHGMRPTGSSIVHNILIGGDIWDYILQLPLTSLPKLYMLGTWNLTCLYIMLSHRWKDGLYDGPTDIASRVSNGVYSKYTDAENDMPSQITVSTSIFKQRALIWQLGVVLVGVVLVSPGFVSCKLEAIRTLIWE
mmetsp:Transcript_20427/g.38358  ORF Transcript_20427/g.38358 Transcript_20427/m.38358 type:complete len:699 (-) Transcript_20427:248-2344(-)